MTPGSSRRQAERSSIGWRAAIAAACACVVAGATAPAWALGTGQSVDLRVLVLSADGQEPTFQAWTSVLTREGVPFDVIVANSAAPITAATLEVSATRGRYHAVVIATGWLVQCDASGCFSALDLDEWAALNAYQSKFGIRRATAYAYPTPEFGLNYPFFAGDVSGSVAALTDAGKAVHPYLVGPVPLDVGTYGYHAAPLAQAPDSGTSFTTIVAGPASPGGVPSALVGVYGRADGFEELVVTYSSNPWQMQTLLLGHGLVGWVTHGLRLGYTRNYYTMHIDDIFLSDDRWDMVDNTTYEDDGATNPTIRMVAADVDRLLSWQAATGIHVDMVFNGFGSVEYIAQHGSDPLTDALLAVKSSFYWINHTYTHLNLDNASSAVIKSEIVKNRQWATGKGISYHAAELVTGEHSGLANPAMATALNSAKIKWTASDNSRQPTPYAIGGAVTVPRHPSNLYYNVGTFAEQLDEYNYIYHEHCTNTATTTCLTTPATWEQYVNSEASIMLQHVLGNDPRPHYIHQANLAEDGTMYPVLDALLARYKSYVSAPIVQPTFNQASAILTDQATWATVSAGFASGAITATYGAGKVTITAPVGTRVPVTGSTSGVLYGGEKSGWFKVGKTGTLKLTAAVPF